MSLAEFMAQNIEKVENEKYVATKRIKDKNGKPIPWELKAVPTKEVNAIRKSCTRQVQTPIRGQFKTETDYELYGLKLTVASVVYPDLNNAELQNSYGVMGATDLLQEMLTIGELQDLTIKAQEVNGLQITMEEMVDEAKN